MTPLEYASFVETRVKWFSVPNANFHHAATGMMGEAVELAAAVAPKEIEEELGDFLFYHEQFRQAMFRAFALDNFGYALRRDWWVPPSPDTRDMVMAAANLNLLLACWEVLDKTKKFWVYNKPITQDEAQSMYEYIDCELNTFANLFGLNLERAAEANVAKLRLRYPDGYTDAAAQARADKQRERA